MAYSIKDIDKVVKLDGQINNVNITRLTAKGENFLSLVFRVDFEVEKNGKKNTISTVAKRFPVGSRMMDFTGFQMINEIRWYSEIVPLYEKYGQTYGIDTDLFPEYMGSRLSLDPSKTQADEESVLLLRNLNPQGFKNEDRHVGFDLPTAKSLLKSLAVFHATPLAMKFLNPEAHKVFKDYLDSCKPPHPPPPGPDGPGGFPPGKYPPDILILRKLVELPACQSYRRKLEALKNEARPPGPEFMHLPGAEPWNTVVHGDCWVNNILIKEQEGTRKKWVKFVDFQMCFYSSYAKDLVFFLLSSVKDEVQNKHFDELLRYYYDEFTSIFETNKIPELSLSYEEYLKEVTRVAKESEVQHALSFSAVVFGPKDAKLDVVTGEIDLMDHMEATIKNMSNRQKEKLAIIVKLAAERNWI